MIHIENSTDKTINGGVICIPDYVFVVSFCMPKAPPNILALSRAKLIVPQRHHDGIFFPVYNCRCNSAVICIYWCKGIFLNIRKARINPPQFVGFLLDIPLASALLLRSFAINKSQKIVFNGVFWWANINRR